MGGAWQLCLLALALALAAAEDSEWAGAGDEAEAVWPESEPEPWAAGVGAALGAVVTPAYRGPGNNDTRANRALPIVLWWSGGLFPHFPADTARVDCARGSCLATRRRQVWRQRRTRALLFYGTDFRAYEAPLPRLPHQAWALFHEESPMNNYALSHAPGIRLFNYTATFRRESHYPLTLQWLPSLAYLRREPLPLPDKERWRQRGYGPVLYLQSHCDVPADRDRYVRQLMNYIQVSCLPARACHLGGCRRASLSVRRRGKPERQAQASWIRCLVQRPGILVGGWGLFTDPGAVLSLAIVCWLLGLIAGPAGSVWCALLGAPLSALVMNLWPLLPLL